jgi:predicted  nucleic acid-binding Zn-ribbon protein
LEELDNLRQSEASLRDSLSHLESEFNEAQKRIDDLTHQFEKTEQKLLEY